MATTTNTRLPLTTYVTRALARFNAGHTYRVQCARWYRAMATRLHIAATTYDSRGMFASAAWVRAALQTCERYAAR